MLVITAEDDPFVPYVSFLAARVEKNPAIQFAPTRHGGHCAYISSQSGAERFWAEERIVDFCEGIWKEDVRAKGVGAAVARV
jgi:predicted alpha/beta-fold hydrolase